MYYAHCIISSKVDQYRYLVALEAVGSHRVPKNKGHMEKTWMNEYFQNPRGLVLEGDIQDCRYHVLVIVAVISELLEPQRDSELVCS